MSGTISNTATGKASKTKHLATAYDIFKRANRDPRWGYGKTRFSARALDRQDKNPSLSVFVGYKGTIMYKDFATGKSGPLVKYLEEHAPEYAHAFKGKEVPQGKRAKKTINEEVQTALQALEGKPVPIPKNDLRAEMVRYTQGVLVKWGTPQTEYIRTRLPGLTPTELTKLGVGADENGNIAIPSYVLHNGTPTLVNIKIRHKSGKPRYSYRHGQGQGVYMVGNTAEPYTVFLVEGELNAIALGAALLKANSLDKYLCIGLPGANTLLPQNLKPYMVQYASKGALFMLKADNDGPGRNLVVKLMAQLAMWGIPAHQIGVANWDRRGEDINDIYARFVRLGVEPQRLWQIVQHKALQYRYRYRRPSTVGKGHGLMHRLEHSGSLRAVSIATGKHYADMARLEDRTKPFEDQTAWLLQTVYTTIARKLGYAGRSHIRNALFALLRDITKEPSIFALARAYASTFRVEGDKTTYGYFARHKLLDRYKHLLTWSKDKRPIWHISTHELVELLVQMLLERLPANVTLTQVELGRVKEYFARINDGQNPTLTPPKGQTSALWTYLMRIADMLKWVVRDRIAWAKLAT